MIIALFGESCTGKSTLAKAWKKPLGARVYSGKDYVRLAKNEAGAKDIFREIMRKGEENILCVISKNEQLASTLGRHAGEKARHVRSGAPRPAPGQRGADHRGSLCGPPRAGGEPPRRMLNTNMK